MTAELNFLDLFLKASIVVQLVILILIIFSITSWAIIIQRSRVLTKALKESMAFEDRFWSGEDLNKLYEGLSNRRDGLSGSEQIFYVGFKEFSRLKQANPDADPYVQVGDSVKKGQVLCLIEAMKLMNEIVAPQDGVVSAILVENENIVEYGQALFRIS